MSMKKIAVKSTQIQGDSVIITHIDGSHEMKDIYHSTEIGVLLCDMITYIRFNNPNTLEVINYNDRGRHG